MRFKEGPIKYVGKYRQYSSTQLTDAYNDIKDSKASVYSAARKYSVPEQTLRDRVLGKIDIDVISSGKSPTLSLYEEAKIVDHINCVAKYGYGYTRQEVVNIATDYAVQLGKRTVNKPFTQKWFDQFAKRWPEIRVSRPRALELQRAKNTSETVVSAYFNNLEQILDRYNLKNKPHLILNVDEKGISENHVPPHVVCSVNYHPQAVTSGKSQTTTIIGCGSAGGVALPPYFVFAGKRMMPDLVKGASPGAGFSMSETGWSNTDIFRSYLKDHFMKYAPQREPGEHLLLLLDGHKSHIAIDLVDWAVSHNIIMFILPAHTSHVLQPLDVSCYGPLQRMYNSFCHSHTRGTSASVTRYDICQLACKAYVRALSAENLFSGFSKTGIYPFNRVSLNKDALCPAEVFQQNNDGSSEIRENVVEIGRKNGTNDSVEREKGVSTEGEEGVSVEGEEGVSIEGNEGVRMEGEEGVNIEGEEGMRMEGEEGVMIDGDSEIVSPSNFMNDKLNKLKVVKSEGVKKIRKTMSKVVSGKPITENEVKSKMVEHLSTQNLKKGKNVETTKRKKKVVKGEKKQKVHKSESKSRKTASSPQPGPSHFYVSDSEISSDDSIDDSEKCCVCGQFTPAEVRKSTSFIITKWVQCDTCAHWVHLGFCTSIRVVRRGDTYLCPHCTLPTRCEE